MNVVAFAARHDVSLCFCLFQVAGDFGRAQELVDALGRVDCVVAPEHKLWRIFQLDAPRKLAAQKSLVAVERERDCVAVLAASELANTVACFRSGLKRTSATVMISPASSQVLDVLGLEDFRECVPNELARAKLPLRGAFCRFDVS